MCPLRAVIALACLLAAIPAAAESFGSKKGSLGGGNDGPYDRLEKLADKITGVMDANALMLRVNLNPVLRQIVCRIAYHPFTTKNLRRAMHIKQSAAAEAVEKLKFMGLVTFKRKGGEDLVVPTNREAKEMMRRWADEWCVDDDTCGVKK